MLATKENKLDFSGGSHCCVRKSVIRYHEDSSCKTPTYFSKCSECTTSAIMILFKFPLENRSSTRRQLFGSSRAWFVGMRLAPATLAVPGYLPPHNKG